MVKRLIGRKFCEREVQKDIDLSCQRSPLQTMVTLGCSVQQNGAQQVSADVLRR
jgi:hypothetical protein